MSTTAKAEVAAMLRNLPDDCTFEDIRYNIGLLQRMQEAEDDIAAGRIYTQEEVEARFGRWLSPDPPRDDPSPE